MWRTECKCNRDRYIFEPRSFFQSQEQQARDLCSSAEVVHATLGTAAPLDPAGPLVGTPSLACCFKEPPELPLPPSGQSDMVGELGKAQRNTATVG